MKWPAPEDILAWIVVDKAKKILLRHAIVVSVGTLLLALLGLKSFNDFLASINDKTEKAALETVRQKAAEITERQYREVFSREMQKILYRMEVDMPEMLANRAVATTNASWIYLGIRKNDKWLEQVFAIDTVPSSNQEIEARMNVFKRQDRARLSGDDWVFGRVVGLVRKGERVRVVSTESAFDADGALYLWAKIAK